MLILSGGAGAGTAGRDGDGFRHDAALAPGGTAARGAHRDRRRVAVVSSISLASVGQLIGVSSLGYLIVYGYQRDFPEQI